MKKSVIACALLAGCAVSPAPPLAAPQPEGLLPGSIGVFTVKRAGGLVVAELNSNGPAAGAGVRPGDRLLRYNGIPLSSVREFNRRVLDTPPGSVVRLELQRDGEARVVEVPVRELDTMPRV